MMTKLVLYLFLLESILYSGARGAIASDEINGIDLPGWNKPLPSKHYSGYIHLSNNSSDSGKYFHYWFVESERDPTNDPLVLWLNGGPGCSSLDGLFNEMGPLHFNRSGYVSGLPELVYNTWTWTKFTNMIYLESPVGVGFSYSENPKIDYVTNDEQTAKDNHRFLINWFKYYSEYKDNDFYIFGESYAGIYVPTLVYQIMTTNNDMQSMSTDKLNLKGFAVGNGCIGNAVGSCSQLGLKTLVDFYYGHGLFSSELYANITKTCDYSSISDDCGSLLTEMSQQIGLVNIYDIYANCYINFSNPLYSRTDQFMWKRHYSSMYKKSGRLSGPLDCIDDHVERSYFDNENVRQVIHVASQDTIGGWHICTREIKYTRTTKSLLSIYPTLIERYRTMIYNGDVDGAVPYNGDEEWTSGLGYPVEKPWTAWMLNGQVAGYVTSYSVNRFKFVTVKGAGHMVPQYKPQAAYEMYKNFIEDLDFTEYS